MTMLKPSPLKPGFGNCGIVSYEIITGVPTSTYSYTAPCFSTDMLLACQWQFGNTLVNYWQYCNGNGS